ncbi:anhydro-N-acetylmuramic acid kinase [Roseiterribacter gracilis]|uniref:Anhydro-N-acetylmuramic acid kinase n=1 Tax=Roseiterribacter gracilis TaxID=2812848 RepID=A0A8S8XGM3_9PROT|nr:anhydro-N-acetylmuramic acid kinase [Rhodospirillales bacterium TMPK1]
MRTAVHTMTAIGLMSGTSMDGIDAALLETDGEAHLVAGPALMVPYPAELRSRLRSLVLEQQGDVAAIERDLTLAHAEIVRLLLADAGLDRAQVDLLGFHGHTLLHAPHERRTWQIGDGALLAATTGIATVNDFRSADVAAGGQGAPLVPLYHAALAASLPKPVAVLNLGGVGNVTWLGPNNDIRAFDCGPGNALLDDWMTTKLGRAYDEDGAVARAGRVDATALASLLSHPFFDVAGPKSLDRNSFSSAPVQSLSVEDGAATLLAFTVEAARRAILREGTPLQVLVTGGGRRNSAIMDALRDGFAGSQILSVDAIGWDGDVLEAQAFAYLAVRSLRGLPLSLPGTTGVPAPQLGGVLHKTTAERSASAA